MGQVDLMLLSLKVQVQRLPTFPIVTADRVSVVKVRGVCTVADGWAPTCPVLKLLDLSHVHSESLDRPI